jgi:hypothetical protein
MVSDIAMTSAAPVLESLRRTLVGDPPAAFLAELVARLQQLTANVIDGRALAAPDASALRDGILELVRIEALPRLAAAYPGDALRALDKLKAYGLAALESERAALEAERAARFPPPPAPDWPELFALRRAALESPPSCRLGAPAAHVAFAHELERRGLPLPDELLALYAFADGFELTARAAPGLPVLALVASASIDELDAGEEQPPRALLFQGGDAEQLCVYRDGDGRWQLLFEYDYEPVARRPLDVRALLRFGLERMAAPLEILDDELTWDRFFGLAR